MRFKDKLKELTKATLFEDEEMSTKEDFPFYAIEVTSDFEGNTIPKQYRSTPVYLAKQGKRYYFTKKLEYGRSLFSKDDESVIKDVDDKFSDLQHSKVEEFPQRLVDLVNKQSKSVTDKEIDNVEPAQKGIDLAKDKEKHPDMVTPDAKVIHSSTMVDTREIEEYINNGIHPNIVYADHPKPGWWYEDENGEKHLIRLYGITDKMDDKTNVVVKEVLPFADNGGYLKQQEGPSFLMPVEEFRDIIRNEFNTETYEELMKKVPEEERDDPDAWMDQVMEKKQKMLARFNNWKERYGFKYNFDDYTNESLMKTFEANLGKQIPLDLALELYGKKKEDIRNAAFLKSFKAWKAANNEKYNLDRFSDEDLYGVFSDVRYKGDSISTALMNNIYSDETDDSDEEDFVGESVSLEEAPRSPEDARSKNWIISDPNLLRDMLSKLDIDPVYVSNPFEVNYRNVKGKDTPSKFDKPDSRYMIVGIRRPQLGIPADQIDPDDITTLYIKDWDTKGARAEAISLEDLYDMLSVAKHPDLWSRYRTYKDQKRALNRGTYYKYVDIPDEVVRDSLNSQMKASELFRKADLLALYDEALKTHEENGFVTRALRAFAKETTIRAKGGKHNFKGYQYAEDTRTHKPTEAKFGGFGGNPYNYLMHNTWDD